MWGERALSNGGKRPLIWSSNVTHIGHLSFCLGVCAEAWSWNPAFQHTWSSEFNEWLKVYSNACHWSKEKILKLPAVCDKLRSGALSAKVTPAHRECGLHSMWDKLRRRNGRKRKEEGEMKQEEEKEEEGDRRKDKKKENTRRQRMKRKKKKSSSSRKEQNQKEGIRFP